MGSFALLEAEPADAGRFEVAAVGVDDLTFGFDMQGSKSVSYFEPGCGCRTLAREDAGGEVVVGIVGSPAWEVARVLEVRHEPALDGLLLGTND